MHPNSPVFVINMNAEIIDNRTLESGNLASFIAKMRLRFLEILNTENIVPFKIKIKLKWIVKAKQPVFRMPDCEVHQRWVSFPPPFGCLWLFPGTSSSTGSDLPKITQLVSRRTQHRSVIFLSHPDALLLPLSSWGFWTCVWNNSWCCQSQCQLLQRLDSVKGSQTWTDWLASLDTTPWILMVQQKVLPIPALWSRPGVAAGG